MASAGLLLLLLVSSSLILSSLSSSYKSGEERKLKEDVKIIAKYFDKSLKVVTPLLAFIPVAGPYLRAISNVAQSIMNKAGVGSTDSTLGVIMDEFKTLHIKLDYVQTKWDTAEKDYNKYRNYIHRAWEEYEELREVCSDPKKSSEEKKKLLDHFIKLRRKVLKYTERLHDLLTNRDPTSAGGAGLNKFGDALAKHVRCHEMDLRFFIMLTTSLIEQGIIMTRVHDPLYKTEKLTKMFVASTATLFKIEKYCLSNFMNYIKEDVEDIVKKNKNDKKKIAEDTSLFLRQTYDKYVWMVIVFKTKSSEKFLAALNKHTTYNFKAIKVGKLTVSVAKQEKGTYNKAKKVAADIESCIGSKTYVQCSEIPKTLNECKTKDGKKNFDSIVAIHAYIKDPHQIIDAKNIKAKDPKDPAGTTYFYEGRCKDPLGFFKAIPVIPKKTRKEQKTGKFVALIKSDEEIENKNPCEGENCGGTRGECKVLENTLIPVCECKGQNYGKNCEESLKEKEKTILDAKMSC